jgi:hypothetical protein
METTADRFSIAPDVSPEDVWGDAACLAPSGHDPALILPSKRVKHHYATAFDGDDGLRIGTRNLSQSATEEPPHLEVQEIIHGDVVRLHPEEPEAGRMPRHHVFHEKPDDANESERTGESREWGSSGKQSILWILGGGIAVATVVVAAIIALPYINEPNAARPHSGDPEWVVENIADGVAIADMLSRKAEAGRIFRAALTTSSSDDILPLVRNPGEVAELIRSSRRMPVVAPDSQPLKIKSWVARENQSLTYGILTGTLPDHSGFVTYFTLTNGRLTLDWKASTAYGTADFTQLTRNQGNAAEIRGWLEPAESYTGSFRENSHQSYQLASPDKQQVIWAYARRGAEIDQALKVLIKGGYIIEGRKEGQKVTVRLAPGPGNSPPGQWEIVELLHKEWIAP